MSTPDLTGPLDAIRAAVEASARVRVVGLVEAAAGGRVRLETQNATAITSTFVRPEDLPEAMRPPLAAPASIAAPPPRGGPERGLDRIVSIWGLRSIYSVPLGSRAVLWAAADQELTAASVLTSLADGAARLESAAAEDEPIDACEDRLLRMESLSEALDALGAALDVREVFGQLSAMARRVLPHDAAVIGVPDDGNRRIRFHALSAPTTWQLPDAIDNPYPDADTQAWDFVIHRDLREHPVERSGIASRMGLRSAMRVAVRIGGRVHGAIDFSAFDVERYRPADVAVARRVADYVSLALSHQRLADEAREAEEVRERAANLEMLDGLLETIADALDVRDVFDRLSAISEKVIAHDAMAIAMPAGGGVLRIQVATGALGHLPTPFDIAAPKQSLLEGHWDHDIIDDLPGDPHFREAPSVAAGMRSMLSLPAWVEGSLAAVVNFFSRTPARFSTDDVLIGRRIAEHIALTLSHHRLAEEARRTVELRARAANAELLEELLSTMPEGASLGEMFDRISTIARRVLPHDTLLLPVALPDGVHARLHARGGAESDKFPEIVQVPDSMVASREWEHDIADDLQADPAQQHLEATRRGYRSALRVPIRLDGRNAGALVFLSFASSVYLPADVPVARRIADRIALLLARERRTEASRRAEEAESRAARLEARVRALTEELDVRSGYRRVIGESAAWKQVLTQATQVAETDTTVLLLGESGTGKEVVARFTHRASPRRDGPFVALNCAALPENLLEAELFGYERGAFTGAVQSKPGQLEQAAGGTLFLDEIGEMSLPAQAKFLRVLQEREFQRLGGTRVLRTDARIVAATNRDLRRAIAQGSFREDLFYRLNVFAIELPPLRERRDDVVALTDAFLAEIGRGLGRPPAGVSRDARQMLVEHHWPGNVRELRNMLERAAILCDGGLITPDHLAIPAGSKRTRPMGDAGIPAGSERTRPTAERTRPTAEATRPASEKTRPTGESDVGRVLLDPANDLKSMERTLIHQALQHARFNKSKAAKALGLTRAQLYVRMRRYGLE